MLQTIKELIEGAFVGQAILATMVVATSCFLVARGQSVPEWFVGITAAIIAWYFREQTAARAFKQELAKSKLPKVT